MRFIVTEIGYYLLGKNDKEKTTDMKARFTLYMMLLLLHGVMWTSCSGCLDGLNGDYSAVKVDSASGVVYDHFIALPDRGWDREDSAVFELPLFERDADLDVTITVRHTNRYPYQNLQLVAFLAELDTSNIINSLPIRKNDDRIDSLIHRQDSLQQEKAQTEQKLAERRAQQDSLNIRNSDSLHQKKEESSRDTLSEDTLKGHNHNSVKDTDPDSLQSSDKKSSKEKNPKKSEKDKSAERSEKEKEAKKSGDSGNEGKESGKETKKGSKGKHSSDKGTPSDSLTHVIEFNLFNSEDEKNGSGMMFVETDVPCGTIHLKANTRYKIFITHNMKEGRLKGISDIGIELKGCKKQPIDKMNTKWWDKQKKKQD